MTTPARRLTTRQVAERFNVRRETVSHWVATGRLRSIKTPGGHLRIREEDVDAFFDDELPAETDEATA